MLLIAAIAAGAAHLNHRPRRREARSPRRIANAARQAVVVDMDCLSAAIANQENAVVQAAGMLIGDISVGAFNAPREIGIHEQIEDPVDAICSDAAPLRLGHFFGDVIGACRLAETGQRVEYRSAHVGPLFALVRELLFGRFLERLSFVELVLMLGHDWNEMR